MEALAAMLSLFSSLGGYLTPYLNEIATAVIACGLVVFGADINRLLRRTLAGQHFILRTLIFILINAFGFGLLIVKASPLLSQALRGVSHDMLAIGLLTWFLIIGLWAQKHRQV